MILFLALIVKPGVSQEKSTMRFSLQEAQQYAIENNFEIKNKQLDIELARKKIWETTTIGLPQVEGSGAYQQFLDIPTQLIPAEFFGGEPGTFMPVQFGTKHNANFGLTVSQLIFSGEYIVGLQASRIFLELSAKGLTKSENEIKESVAKSYYLVLVATESRQILTKSLDNMKNILREMEEIYKEGMIEDTDVDQMRLTVSNIENSLKNLDNQAELANRLLKFQLGIEFEENIELTESLEAMITAGMISPSLIKQFDLSRTLIFSCWRLQKTFKN
jgi:outer membrane protein